MKRRGFIRRSLGALVALVFGESLPTPAEEFPGIISLFRDSDRRTTDEEMQRIFNECWDNGSLPDQIIFYDSSMNHTWLTRDATQKKGTS